MKPIIKILILKLYFIELSLWGLADYQQLFSIEEIKNIYNLFNFTNYKKVKIYKLDNTF